MFRKWRRCHSFLKGRRRRCADERTVPGSTDPGFYIFRFCVWVIRSSIGQAPVAIVRLGVPAAISSARACHGCERGGPGLASV
jgi:hypothetical protein